MGLFDFGSTSTAEVALASRMAWAAYQGEPLPGEGWLPLDGDALGFVPLPLPGSASFNGIYYEYTSGVLGTASAVVFRNGDKLAISFRGTDSDVDFGDIADYFDLLDSSYISHFDPLLNTVAEFIVANQISEIIITGHSLGAAATNELRDISATAYDGVFNDATYIGFATPVVADRLDILNFGFENDAVFKVAEAIDQTSVTFFSTTDNIVFYNDEYSDPSWPGDVFTIADSDDWSSHDKRFYVDAVQRIALSDNYRLMSRDSVVIVINTTNTVIDRDVRTSSHFNSSTFYIGQETAVDTIIAGTDNDYIEGFGGNDVLNGGL